MAVQQSLRKLNMGLSLLILPTLSLFLSAISLTMEPTEVVCNIVIVVTTCCLSLNLVQGLTQWKKSVDIGWLIFNSAVFFWFLLPGVLRMLDNSDWSDHAALISAGPDDFVMALLIINIFYFLFCVGYSLGLPRQILNALEKRAFPATSFQADRNFIGLVILLTFTLLFYVILSGGINDAAMFFTSGRTGARPWDSIGNYGTAFSPFHNAATSLRILLAIIFGYIFLQCPLNRRRRIIAGTLWFITALSVVIESGTRAQLILCFGPPLILYMRSKLLQNSASKFKALSLMIIMAVLLAFVGSFLRTFRNAGDMSAALANSEVAFEDNDGLLHTAFAYQEMKLVPPTHDSVVLHIITGPFPRFLWPGKPEIEAMNVHSLYVWGRDVTRTGGNTLPYIPGQYLLSWGWFGLLEVGFFLGLIISIIDNILVRSRSPYTHIFCAIFFCYIFVAFRLIGFFFSFSSFLAFVAIHLQARRDRRRIKH